MSDFPICPHCEAWAHRALQAEAQIRVQLATGIKRESSLEPFMRLKREIYLRDGGRCVYCLSNVAPGRSTLDHLVPRSFGGPAKADNLVLCCQTCNSIRGTMPLTRWLLDREKPVPGGAHLLLLYENTLAMIQQLPPLKLLPALDLSGASFKVTTLKRRSR